MQLAIHSRLALSLAFGCTTCRRFHFRNAEGYRFAFRNRYGDGSRSSVGQFLIERLADTTNVNEVVFFAPVRGSSMLTVEGSNGNSLTD